MAQVPLGKPDFGMPAVENAKISPAAARRGNIAKNGLFTGRPTSLSYHIGIQQSIKMF